MNNRSSSFLVNAANLGSNDTEGRRMVIDCGGMNVATVQAEIEGETAWSTAVLTVTRTNRQSDGTSFPLETPTTLTTDGITIGLDVSAFRYLVVSTTTPQASLTIRVTVYTQE